ncbi:MAG: UDP-glucose/GDP-mannose dehydrogenase family protein [Patescibacteria group bacterium]
MAAKKPNITVIGSGYVGLTTSAIMANCGYTVYALEVNSQRLDIIKQGRSFFYEEGLDNLVGAAVKRGSLIPTDSYEKSIPNSDIIFSCVGTPDNPDGSSNLSYIFAAAEEAAKHIKPGTVYVQKSTVPVGTAEKIKAIFKKYEIKSSYLSNPEFLREGTAIADSIWFDRVVIGAQDSQAIEQVANLYRTVEKSSKNLLKIARIKQPKTLPKSQYIFTNLASAELIKVSANAFLALKISFANSIAKLADQTGSNIKEVMDGIGSDNRIGRAFLNAGRGYGGGCFPKDVSGLIRSAADFGVPMEIMEAATEVNTSMPHYIINKAEQKLGGSFKGKKIAVLGLAFKAGTSDARKSQAIVIANTLVAKGAVVKAYDPKAAEQARREGLSTKITVCDSALGTIKDADSVFFTTDWPEFKKPTLLRQLKKDMLVVDCMNMLDRIFIAKKQLDYVGVGLNGNK